MQQTIQTIGIVGGTGNIGSIVSKNLAEEKKYTVTIAGSPDHVFTESDKESFTCAKNLLELVDSNLLIFCPKPAKYDEAWKQLGPHFTPQHLILSGVGGRDFTKMNGYPDLKVARFMPTILTEAGMGIIFLANKSIPAEQFSEIGLMLQKMCTEVIVSSEKNLHLSTIFSGSMPAVVAAIMDALNDEGNIRSFPDSACEVIIAAAKQYGFTDREARVMLQENLLGVSKLRKTLPFDEIIRKVKTKGGCTEAMFDVFYSMNLRLAVIDRNDERIRQILSEAIDAGIAKLGHM